MEAVGGFGVVSFFFFFFCAEAVEASVRLRSRKREKKSTRRVAMRMVEGSFLRFMLDSLPKFEARFGC
jgi:hypothetical protein